MTAGNQAFVLRSHFSGCSEPCQPHPELTWIPIWWEVYGSLAVYCHMEWSICNEISTELCMAECHDLYGTEWRMQMMKHFVKLFQCILLNEWTNNCAAVTECMRIGQKKGIHSSYILGSLFLSLLSREDSVFWGMMLHHWVISEWYFEGHGGYKNVGNHLFSDVVSCRRKGSPQQRHHEYSEDWPN